MMRRPNAQGSAKRNEQGCARQTCWNPNPSLLEMLDGVGSDSEVSALVDALGPIVLRSPRTVIFCGRGSLAEVLCEAVRTSLPDLEVGEHTVTAGSANSNLAVAAWKARGGVLIADHTAEDGLNLQQADAVVHCRIPWSPNRLEQRLGRVDRYVGAASTVLARPARQYALAYPEGEFCLSGAWLRLLTDGFGIFDESISTLHDVIDQGAVDQWSAAVDEGPRGLVGSIQEVRSRLAAERRNIDGMDLLESVHESATGLGDVASSVDAFEVEWKYAQAALVGYAGDRPGGLRFSTRQCDSSQRQLVRFERGRADPLMPPGCLPGISGHSVTHCEKASSTATWHYVCQVPVCSAAGIPLSICSQVSSTSTTADRHQRSGGQILTTMAIPRCISGWTTPWKRRYRKPS